MSMREIWICDDDGCDVQVTRDWGDYPPLGWVFNVDGDDFCPKHAPAMGAMSAE